MNFYLKQNKFSMDTRLYFYDEQEQLCFVTNRGINNADKGIEILDINNESVIQLSQNRHFLLTNNYDIKLSNGGHIDVFTPNFITRKFRISNKLFSLTNTKRKTYLLCMGDTKIMEFAIKKGRLANYTRVVVFHEQFTPIALAFVTTICCTRYHEEKLLFKIPTALL